MANDKQIMMITLASSVESRDTESQFQFFEEYLSFFKRTLVPDSSTLVTAMYLHHGQ